MAFVWQETKSTTLNKSKGAVFEKVASRAHRPRASQSMKHQLTRERLNAIYKELEVFIADCTYEEYKSHEAAIKEVQTMIHQKTL